MSRGTLGRSAALRAVLGAMAAMLIVATGSPSLGLGSARNSGGLSWGGPVLVDRFPPIVDRPNIDYVQCPSAHLCVATDVSGDLLTSTDPTRAGSWSVALVPHLENGSLDAAASLSCPSVDLCVAGGQADDIMFSTNPAGGAKTWRAIQLPGSQPIVQLSCPSANFCIAIDENGVVLSSTHPDGGQGAWREQTTVFGNLYGAPAQGEALSCPSANFCAAVEWPGAVFTSDDPTGGASAWHKHVIDPGSYNLDGISCPSAHLCLAFAGADAGRTGAETVFSSTTPLTGPWKSVVIDQQGDLAAGVWCDSVSHCITSDLSGNVFASSDPTGGAGAWHQTNVGDRGFSELSCPASSLCVGSTFRGQILTSSDPVLGQWHVSLTDGFNQLTDIACPGAHLCLAVDVAGNVLSSRDPTAGANAWHAHSIDPAYVNYSAAGLTGISCPAENVCVGVDVSGELISSSHPTGGRSAWKRVKLKPSFGEVDCPTIRRCFAIGYRRRDESGLWTTTHPLGGASAWRHVAIHANAPYSPGVPLTGIGCFQDKLCVLGDGGGGVLVSNAPTRAGTTWKYKPGIGAGGKYEVSWIMSCPSLSLCVISDGYEVSASSDPTSEHWKYQLGSGYSSSGGESLTLATCASAHLCFAYGSEGVLYTSHSPAAGPRAWPPSAVDAGGYIDSIACAPGAALCAATSGGDILTAQR